jgi:subtilisin family serine protease
MATPHVSGVLALVLQKDLLTDNEIDLNQTLAENLLESSTLPITWYSATVREPSGSIVTYTWGPNATGSGLIQADKVIENFPG